MHMFAISDTFEEMSRSISSPVFLVCLTLCVWLTSLTAQSTTDLCQRDESNARQVVLMEQMNSMMQSMNDRQMALMEQMHSTLRSTDRRMEESNEGEDTGIYRFDDSSGDTTHARTHILPLLFLFVNKELI